MKLKKLIELKYVEKLNDKEYRCNKCNKIYTKLGVINHHFYMHETEGIKKRQKLKEIGIKNNNTPEMKKKISEGTKKAFQREDVKENFKKFVEREKIERRGKGNPMYGKTHTKEWKFNHSKIMTGFKMSDEAKNKIRKYHIGKKHTKESIKKMRDVKLGKSKPTPILIETSELCSYGCGQVANYKLKNGKLCCSDQWQKCPINGKKISKGQKGMYMTKPILIETSELCSYGCGQVANYKLKNGKLCCSDNINKCPTNYKKISISKISIPFITTELCSYGCGQVANYKLKNGKLCCSKYYSKCPINRKKISDYQAIKIITTELCSYGCGQVANYKFINGKICCSDMTNKCPIFKRTIEKIKEKYPIFYKEEELRYNPKKPNEKEIQVRCKYNKCKNSKENDGWFTPINTQLDHRIEAIETSYGNGGSYFYCSDKCKEKCFLFRFNPNHFLNNQNTESPHTNQELNIWRQEVLRRQKDEYRYNFCEMCESKENLQVHHEKSQKTHPGMTLDPDNGIILCRKCHYKIGHKTGTECSTGNLANRPC